VTTLELDIDERLYTDSPAGAVPAATSRMLGAMAMIRERTAESWGELWLERLRQDLRFAARLAVITEPRARSDQGHQWKA
jgi:hypothetical protein